TASATAAPPCGPPGPGPTPARPRPAPRTPGPRWGSRRCRSRRAPAAAGAAGPPGCAGAGREDAAVRAGGAAVPGLRRLLAALRPQPAGPLPGAGAWRRRPRQAGPRPRRARRPAAGGERGPRRGGDRELDEFPYEGKINYTLYPITFPSESAAEWKKLFKPCASQRLFLPLILKNVDSLLYVDTDILFLRPVDDIWSFLGKFNSTQIAAMAPEHEEPRIGWYNRFARHPYYGVTGINSGVMLMNMTRIRRKYFKNDMTPVRLQWGEILMPLLKKYKLNITWGDQDLLNIMFFHNPESLYVFPCQWNYRPDHCIYGSNCKAAEEEGIFILHGNRGVYHDDKQPTFRAVYEAIKNYSFGDDLVHSLLQPLEQELQKTMHTYCGRVYKVFIKQLTKSIRDLYGRRSKGR
uniref:Glucoside xylosyltransferase 1 n=1 Tax=Cyanoderma ruficeps TaxID=181631 RepID=A0A8C3REE0_9PASS